MATIGYVHVGPLDHNADFQVDLVRRHGARMIFQDRGTGRPQLTAALEELASGDTLVVWRLDRLGSSSSSVLILLEMLGARGVSVRSVADGLVLDGTQTPQVLHLLSALTNLERCLNREKALVGAYSARSRGRSGGRPRALSPTDVDRLMALRDQGASVREIAEELGTSRATVYRAIEAWARSQDDEPQGA